MASAVVDLAFQIVLDGEEDWSGLAEEERAWEEENRGEVNMPPFPPQARMCRQLGDGTQKIAKSGSLPNGGIKRTQREEDQRVDWMNAGDPLTSDALGNFQQGAKPAAAFSNNLRPVKVAVPNQHLSYPPLVKSLSALFRRGERAVVRRKLRA